ncbi:hypothetical protein C0991_006220 [Blastosporella zonata]|nr:hypothetical protein C0991_006220 [Blastosporella zonata]
MALIPGGLLFIGAFFLTESPRWLISRDRNTEALKNLSYLRNLPEDHPYVIEEYQAIEATIVHERGLVGAGFFGPLRTVFANKMLVRRLLIGSSLFAWQNGTGINAINYYSFVDPAAATRHYLIPAPQAYYLQINWYRGNQYSPPDHRSVWHQ